MDWYANALNELEKKPRTGESEVCNHLITPLLKKVLGFSISEIDMERQEGRRPDYVCTRSGSRSANVIVEAKRLNTDLRRRTTQDFASSPVGQLRRYLNTFPAADEGTCGVVTNGTQWIILRRNRGLVPITAIGEPVEARSLARVTELLSPLRERTKSSSKVQEAPPIDWFSVAADCESPHQFMQRIAPTVEKQTGWNSASFAQVGEYTPPNGQLFREPIYLACLSLDFPDGRLSPQDIAEELLMLSTRDGRVAGIAYTTSRPECDRSLRAFLRENGKLHATALVDAQLPESRATRQVRLLAKDFTKPDVTSVITVLSAESLQRQFHEEISAWFECTAGSRNELRHLIRILFAWLLQERGVVPEDTLWRAELNWRELPEGSIHDHILWLFE